MSIDISLMIDTGRGELHEVIDVGNYTHNCQAMWTLALNANLERVPEPVNARYAEREILTLCAFDGMSAEAAIPYLKAAVAYMDDPANRATFEAMEPDNGWGSFNGARNYLRKLLDACIVNPGCVIDTSC